MRDRCKAVIQTVDYGIYAQAILIAGYPSADIPMDWLKYGLKNRTEDKINAKKSEKVNEGK